MERKPTQEATIKLFFRESNNLESFISSMYQLRVKPSKGKLGYLSAFKEKTMITAIGRNRNMKAMTK
jgi:hypothetical protein